MGVEEMKAGPCLVPGCRVHETGIIPITDRVSQSICLPHLQMFSLSAEWLESIKSPYRAEPSEVGAMILRWAKERGQLIVPVHE